MVCSVVWRSGPAIRLTVTSASTGIGGQGLHQGFGVRCGRLDHGRHRKVAVGRNPLPIGVGDVGAGQQAPTQRERLGVLTDPGCASRLHIGCAPGVNLFDLSGDKEVLFGKWDFGGALGKQVTHPIALHGVIRSGDGIQRLGAGRSKVPGAQVGVLTVWPRRTELLDRLREPIHRPVGLLVGATHLDPPRIPLARVDEILHTEVGLGEEKDRPRILGVAFDLGQQPIALLRRLMLEQVAGEQLALAELIICAVVFAFEAHIDARVVPRSGLVGDTLEVFRQRAAAEWRPGRERRKPGSPARRARVARARRRRAPHSDRPVRRSPRTRCRTARSRSNVGSALCSETTARLLASR